MTTGHWCQATGICYFEFPVACRQIPEAFLWLHKSMKYERGMKELFKFASIK
jgi:hypothetical protein